MESLKSTKRSKNKSITKVVVLPTAEAPAIFKNIGQVTSVRDGVVNIKGFRKFFAGEVVRIGKFNVIGLALTLEKNDSVSFAIFGGDNLVSEGDLATRTYDSIVVPTGVELLGRVVDGLGKYIDAGVKLTIHKNKFMRTSAVSPGIIERQAVNQPLQTGILAIDSMIPIGKGQRELIIGDRQTGKTAIALDTIINQKFVNLQNSIDAVMCVYVAIGQKCSTIVQITEKLRRENALWYTTIVAATASDAAALQFLAPYTGAVISEYHRDNGRNALIVYDDLTKQAIAYRQICLLLRRSPGREAYPGDVFWLHSRLLERAARLSQQYGGGSLTALPIIETQMGDVSSYIPTNVISITDGQIFLEKELFNRGIMPAINVGLSVSRIGSAAQVTAMKRYAGNLKLSLAQYREVEAFSAFASDLDESTLQILTRGSRIIELLKQPQYSPMSIEEQIMLIFLGTSGEFDRVIKDNVTMIVKQLLKFIRSQRLVLVNTKTNSIELNAVKMLQKRINYEILFQ